jgi:hypothetical protein
LDKVVVGDDVAVGRDDKARAERAGLAGARLRLRAFAGCNAALSAEPAEEFLERVGLLLDRDALLGRDVDHRRLEPRGEVGKAHRRARTRRHRRRRILRNLSADRTGGDRKRGTAEQ